MDLSPNDIRNYEFSNQMRGYDKEEVDNLLDEVAAALEQARQETLKFSMEAESLNSQLTSLKQFEDTIKAAAIDARRNADMTIATAKQEAEMHLSKAKSEAERIISTRADEVANIEKQITKLGITRKSYLSKVRSMIQIHLEMISEIEEAEMPDISFSDEVKETPSSDESKNVSPARVFKTKSSSDDVQITQSTDVTTDSRETVGTVPSNKGLESELSDSDHDGEDNDDSAAAQELKNALGAPDIDDPAPNEADASIDPELAAALENYKKTTADSASEGETSMPAAPQQGEVVETNARAEDIPKGFFAKDEDLGEDVSTDRVRVASKEGHSNEPNNLDIAKADPIKPEAVPDELDQVAAKFEAEMDKAEQTQ